jgi:hypothetical protein
MCAFFPLPMIDKSPHLILAACLIGLLLCSGAAQVDDVPSRSEEKAAAHLRGWVAGSASSEAVSLLVQSSRDEQAQTIASAGGGETVVNPSYAQTQPGACQFQVKVGDKILKSVTTKLASNEFYTAVAWSADGKWNLAVYDDGPFAKNVPDRPIRLMNFAGGRATLVSVENGSEIKVPGNAMQEIRVPPKLTAFTVKVLAPDGGAPAQSSGDIDFVSIPSAYVLIAPDYRGRMRPRVILGGNLPIREE